jgi:hypothetical protein
VIVKVPETLSVIVVEVVGDSERDNVWLLDSLDVLESVIDCVDEGCCEIERDTEKLSEAEKLSDDDAVTEVLIVSVRVMERLFDRCWDSEDEKEVDRESLIEIESC